MLLLLTHFVQLMLQHVAVIDALWSGVHHVANYVGGVISSDDVELFFVSSSIKHQMGSNNGQNGHHGTGITIRNQLFLNFIDFVSYICEKWLSVSKFTSSSNKK